MKKLTNSGPLFGFHPVSNRRPLARQVAEQNAVFALSPTAHSRGTETHSGSFSSLRTLRALLERRGVFCVRLSRAGITVSRLRRGRGALLEKRFFRFRHDRFANHDMPFLATTTSPRVAPPARISRARTGCACCVGGTHFAPRALQHSSPRPRRRQNLGARIRLGRALPGKKDRPTPPSRRRRSAPPSPPPLGSSRA